MSTCAVVTCGNKVKEAKGTGIKFFRFPTIPSLRNEWILRCQRDDNFNASRAVVCSKHFTEDDYWRDLKYELLNLPSRKILKKNAVPSVDVPPLPWEKPNRLRLPSCCLWHISTCLEEKGTEEVDFYQFPVRNGDVLEEWMNFTHCPPAADVSKLRLCSRHFQLSDFELFGERVTLKDDAIPSLLPPIFTSLLETDNFSNFSIDSDPVAETVEPVEPELDPTSMYLLVPASDSVTLPRQFELSLNSLSTVVEPQGVVPEGINTKVNGGVLEENIFDDETLVQFLSGATSEETSEPSSSQTVDADSGRSDKGAAPSTELELKNSIELPQEIDPLEVLNEVLTDGSSLIEDSQSQEASSHHGEISEYEELLLENIRSQLCRICGTRQEELLPIFTEDDEADKDKLTLVKKIEMYLPLQIKKNDDLPPNICFQCHDSVQSWHELNVSCVAADSLLQNMLCKKDLVLIQNILEGEGLESESMGTEDDHSAEVKTDLFEDCLLDGDDPTEESIISPSGAIQEHSDVSSLEGSVDNFEMDENPEKENKEWNIENVHEHLNKYPSTERQSLFKFSECEFLWDTKFTEFTCMYCKDTFDLKEVFERHVNECAMAPTVCHQCGKTINRRANLVVHLKKHIPKSYICEKCGKKLNSNFGLQIHMNSKHSGARKSVGFCESCCKVFICANSLLKHIKFHERGIMKNHLNFKFDPSGVVGDKEIYACPVCKESFTSKLSLVEHLNFSKKAQCLICKDWILNERMMLLHTCKWWVCSYCGKRFRSPSILQTHERMHTGEKPFSCCICGAKFSSPSVLQRHEATHQPPAFICDICGKTFKREETHASHMQTHSSDEQDSSFCFK